MARTRHTFEEPLDLVLPVPGIALRPDLVTLIALCLRIEPCVGVPTAVRPKNSMMLRIDASDSDEWLYRATDSIGGWEAALGSELTDLLAATNTWALAQAMPDTSTFEDPSARTKKVRIDAGNVTAGQTRVLTMPDENVTITSPGAALLDDASTAAQRTTLGLGAGDSPTFAGLHLTGDLIVDGTTTQVDAESVLLRANYLLQNVDYTTAAAQPGGLVVNYLPTATVDTTTAAGVVVAGVDGVSDPTITTAGTATFSATDIVQISGSANDGENDGLYEVAGHVGTTLTLKSTSNGVSNRVEGFTRDQLVANAGDTGMAITKVTVSVARVGTDGVWEVGSGSQTGISYSDLLRVADIGSQVQAYSATLAALATEGLTRQAIATVACADATGGGETALMSVQLYQLDGTTPLGAARQFLLQIGSAQYLDSTGPTNASLTLGTVTAGSIVATVTVGTCYLVETDATGLFACTATNTDDETVYFSAKTAEGGVADIAKRCTIIGSNSDAAAWSA